MQTISPYVMPLLPNKDQREIISNAIYKRPMEVKCIIDAILAYRGHTVEDISRVWGSRMVSYTKQLICYFLHTETRLSLNEINVAIGGKPEHTSPLRNIRCIQNFLYSQDELVKQDVANIKYLL